MMKHVQAGDLAWIRQRRFPLTAEQSGRLTLFAEAQEGKPFAVLRLLAQVTPFRSRGPLRTWFVGTPHGDRRSYFCSELVMESIAAAGLLDPAILRPPCTYPRDLFFGRSFNLYLDRHLPLEADWFPPARWTPCLAPDAGVNENLPPHEPILPGAGEQHDSVAVRKPQATDPAERPLGLEPRRRASSGLP
jgi:hypothetical protein